MPTLLVMYPNPADAAAFDRRYKDEHHRLMKAHLGMAKFRERRVLGALGGGVQGTPPYYLIVELEFDSSKAMEKALASEGGRATSAHAAEISTGGPPLILILA